MIKRESIVLTSVGLLSALLICGCQTSKGAAVGVAATTKGVAQGLAQDSKDAWHGIIAADNWIKKNLW